MNLKIALVFGAAFAGAAASGASFDCKKASSAFEKQICSTPSLNEADEAMGKAYAEAIRKFVFPDLIRYDQRNWGMSYRQCKETDKCIQLAKLRQRDLESYLSANVFSDFDGKFAPDGQVVIYRKHEGKDFVRIFGNWMHDGSGDPNKIKGFPHDGFICDTEGQAKKTAKGFASDELAELRFTSAPSGLTVKGFYSCNPRTGFGDAILKRRQ